MKFGAFLGLKVQIWFPVALKYIKVLLAKQRPTKKFFPHPHFVKKTLHALRVAGIVSLQSKAVVLAPKRAAQPPKLQVCTKTQDFAGAATGRIGPIES